MKSSYHISSTGKQKRQFIIKHTGPQVIYLDETRHDEQLSGSKKQETTVHRPRTTPGSRMDKRPVSGTQPTEIGRDIGIASPIDELDKELGAIRESFQEEEEESQDIVAQQETIAATIMQSSDPRKAVILRIRQLMADEPSTRISAMKEMRTLSERWREYSSARQGRHDDLDTEYVDVRAAFFEKVTAEQQENAKKKDSLLERMETVLASKEPPMKLLATVRDIQREYRTPAILPREQVEKYKEAFEILYAKYDERLVHDPDFLVQEKASREALHSICERADLLVDKPIEEAVSGIRSLQLEWKDVGPVEKGRYMLLWKRFDGICSYVFGRFRESKEQERKNHESAIEAAKAAKILYRQAFEILRPLGVDNDIVKELEKRLSD